MADWNTPTTSTAYATVLTNLDGRLDDAATMFDGSPTNLPTNAIRWNNASTKFQRWSGAVWNDMVLSIAGGGTGSGTAAGARTNLGLGTMATQSSGAVSITGGTITGINFSAANITSGILALARGGTGASLALGASGEVLQSNGSAVVFATGAAITALNASNLASGTVPNGRFPATLPAASGVNLTALNATNIASGTLAIARFPTSGTWTLTAALTVAGGGIIMGAPTGGDKGAGSINAQALYVNGVAVNTGTGSGVPSGVIAIFDTSCPAGWTRFAALDNVFIRGATTYGGTGGVDTQDAGIDFSTSSDGDVAAGVTGSGGGDTTGATDVGPDTANTLGDTIGGDTAVVESLSTANHTHTQPAHDHSVPAIPAHTHLVQGRTDNFDNRPAYKNVVFCKKD